jgi:hypothetical protein
MTVIRACSMTVADSKMLLVKCCRLRVTVHTHRHGEAFNNQWLDSVSVTTSGKDISIMVKGPKTYIGSRSSKAWPGGMSQNKDVTLAGLCA